MRTVIEIHQDLVASRAVLVPKAQDWLMRALGHVIGPKFMTQFWTTYRLPFCRARICYPVRILQPFNDIGTIDHELIHVKQLAPWWGPLWMAALAAVVPLPLIFSGRWYIERRAYLADILAGRRTIDDAVHILWSGYGLAWPKKLMRQWFEKEVARHGK